MDLMLLMLTADEILGIAQREFELLESLTNQPE